VGTPSPPSPPPPPPPPAMTSLSGTAYYAGYLSGCTVYLDVDGNGVFHQSEPTAVTTAFGKFEMSFRTALDVAGAAFVVVPGTGCTDISTNIPLAVELRVDAAICPTVSLMSTVGNKIAATSGYEMVPDIVAYGLNLMGTGFDPCAYDPFEFAWSTDAKSEVETRTFKNFMAINLEMITVLKTVSDVTGYESDADYTLASQAVMTSFGVEFEEKLLYEVPGVISFATTEANIEVVEAAAEATGTDVTADADAVEQLAEASAALVSFVNEQVDFDEIVTFIEDGNSVDALTEVARASAFSATDNFDGASPATASAELQQMVNKVSDTNQLEQDLAATSVPEPALMSSPNPPPPPLPPPPESPLPPPPPPPPPITEEEEDVSTSDADDLSLIVFVVLIPIFYALYVMIVYRGVEFKYLSWRFSHTNPFLVFGYMPKERREALWEEVKSRGKSKDMPMTNVSAPSDGPTKG